LPGDHRSRPLPDVVSWARRVRAALSAGLAGDCRFRLLADVVAELAGDCPCRLRSNVWGHFATFPAGIVRWLHHRGDVFAPPWPAGRDPCRPVLLRLRWSVHEVKPSPILCVRVAQRILGRVHPARRNGPSPPLVDLVRALSRDAHGAFCIALALMDAQHRLAGVNLGCWWSWGRREEHKIAGRGDDRPRSTDSCVSGCPERAVGGLDSGDSLCVPRSSVVLSFCGGVRPWCCRFVAAFIRGAVALCPASARGPALGSGLCSWRSQRGERGSVRGGRRRRSRPTFER
jgi:hypothetical protein